MSVELAPPDFFRHELVPPDFCRHDLGAPSVPNKDRHASARLQSQTKQQLSAAPSTTHTYVDAWAIL